MKKKIVAILTTVAMAVAFIPTFSFVTEEVLPDNFEETAQEGLDNTENKNIDFSVEEVADVMDEFIEEEQVNDDIKLKNGEYSVSGFDMEVSIPEDGDNGIVTQTEEGTIEMELPNEVKNEEGVLSDNGTVVYNPDNEDVAVGVQALSGDEGVNRWERP